MSDFGQLEAKGAKEGQDYHLELLQCQPQSEAVGCSGGFASLVKLVLTSVWVFLKKEVKYYLILTKKFKIFTKNLQLKISRLLSKRNIIASTLKKGAIKVDANAWQGHVQSN